MSFYLKIPYIVHLTKNEFIELSEIQQQSLVSKCGEIVIDYLQGECIIKVYIVIELLVKVIDKQGIRRIETYNRQERFKLYEVN